MQNKAGNNRYWLSLTIAIILITGFVLFLLAFLASQTRMPSPVYSLGSQDFLIGLSNERSLGQVVLLDDTNPITDIEFYPKVTPWHGLGSKIFIHLRASPESIRDLAVVQVPFTQFLLIEKIRIPVPPALRTRKSIYILFQTDYDLDAISLWGSRRNLQAQNSLWINGVPSDGQIVYTRYSQPVHIFTGFSRNIFWSRLLLLLKSAILAWFFGGIILAVLRPKIERNLVNGLTFPTLAGIVSLAVFSYALSFLNLKITSQAILLLVSALLAVAVALNRAFILEKVRAIVLARSRIIHPASLIRNLSFQSFCWIDLLILAILAFAVLVNVAQTNNLVVPPGADSWFHYRLLTDIGEIQYIAVDLNYPAGFHAFANGIQLFFPAPRSEVLLETGLFGETIASLSLLILSQHYYRKKFPTLIVLVFSLFYNPVLRNLFFWGRYPFLYGLAILPAALLFSHQAISDRKKIPLAILFVSGLSLFHYGLVLIWFGFLIAFFVSNYASSSNQWIDGPKIKRTFLRLLPIFIALGVLILFRLSIYLSTADFGNVITQSKSMSTGEDPFHLLRLSFENGGSFTWLLVLAVIIFRFGFIKTLLKDYLLWFSLMIAFYLIQTHVIGIVLSSFSNTLIFLIFLLPVFMGAIFEGDLLISNSPLRRWVWVSRASIANLLVLVILVGGYLSLCAYNPLSVFFTNADVQTVEWVNREVRQQSNILVLIKRSQGLYDSYYPSAWLQDLTSMNTFRFEYENEEDLQHLQETIEKNQIQFVISNTNYPEEKNFLIYCCNPTLKYQTKSEDIYQLP
jgi:hypothetical protein